jgi:hypothetical protein
MSDQLGRVRAWRVRWYNCWLLHSWEPWGEPHEGLRVWSASWAGEIERTPTIVQARRCVLCNKQQLREAR